MNLDNLETIPNSELKLFLKNNNVSKYSKLKRKDLIKKVKGVLKRIQKGGVGGVTDPLNSSSNTNNSVIPNPTSTSTSNSNLNPTSTSTSNPTSNPNSNSESPITDKNRTVINRSSVGSMFQCCIS